MQFLFLYCITKSMAVGRADRACRRCLVRRAQLEAIVAFARPALSTLVGCVRLNGSLRGELRYPCKT